MPRAPPTSNPPPRGSSSSATDEDWDAADPELLTHDAQPAGADPRLRGVRARAGRRGPDPRPGALQHRAGGRRGRLGAARSRARTRSTARTAGTTSSWPRRCTTSQPKGIDPLDDLPDDVRDGAAAHAGRDLRAGPRLQPRPRRLDAPAVARGRRDRHQRHRRRRRAAGRRLRVGAPAGRHRRRRGHLLRRRRGQHRLHAGDASTSPRPGSCRSASSSRTTSTRCRPPSTRPPASRGCPARGPGLRHRQLAGRRHGPARRAPGDAGGARAHARRRRPDGHRGRHLPLLPPERRRSPAARSGYRTKEEERAWRDRDPIDQVGGHLVRRGILAEDEVDECDRREPRR